MQFLSYLQYHNNNDDDIIVDCVSLLTEANSLAHRTNSAKKQGWLCRQQNFPGASIKSCNGTSEAHRLQGIRNENWRIEQPQR